MTRLRNLIVFLGIALFRIPFWRWPSAWDQAQADHREEVNRKLLTLRLSGKVRQDESGRLWITRKDS
jgi:hypothetical protein